MAIIKNIRTLKSAAVLADRTPKSERLNFLRYNLVSGFNGSGKSTLSRIFSSLQTGTKNGRLPEDCTFSIEMSDGMAYECPDRLTGIETRVCVFNTDFVDANLQWAEGRANPVFYIGREQAALADQLKHAEQALPKMQATHNSNTREAQARERAFHNHKRDRARLVATRLRQGNRKYEAPQLASDYASLEFDDSSVRDPAALDALAAVCAQTNPGQQFETFVVNQQAIEAVLATARTLAGKTPGTAMMIDLAAHPTMVPWVKDGHDYHMAHTLTSCLYCGNPITAERRALLAQIFDARLSDFLDVVENEARQAGVVDAAFRTCLATLPDSSAIWPALRASFIKAHKELEERTAAVGPIIGVAREMLSKKRAAPTSILEDSLPAPSIVAEHIEALVRSAAAINSLLTKHNEFVSDFERQQDDARLSIRKHYLAEGLPEYREVENLAEASRGAAETSRAALTDLTTKIADLRSKIQTHGPAADVINALVKSYLGHGELTISAVAEGYELLRHNALVEGSPSEGEKTAIALCYFLSTLRADGRALRDLIVVIDDPLSSLDTKATNFACSMIRSALTATAQLFILTHNQNCMNEFKKSWKSSARGENPDARLLFIDVTKPPDVEKRSASFMTMPKQLRDNDLEYHFLCQKVFCFERDGLSSEYAFMMPNVIRRVLEIFLAFRIPKPGTLQDKLAKLCATYSELEPERLMALERLSQVESHSDSLDDLIAHSSMTVEEARDANHALLELMETTDPSHLRTLRSYCQVLA